jgi:hypothetical protein
MESMQMFDFRLPKTPQMFARKRPFDTPAFAWNFAIF